jgi:hypothetical protein
VQETVNAHVHKPVKPPKELVPEISQATSDAIVKALAKHPKDRFATYNELVEALVAARSGLMVAKFEAEHPEAAEGRRKTEKIGGAGGAPKKKTGLLVGVAVVVFAAIGAAAWFFTRPAEEAVVEEPPATNQLAQTNLPQSTNVAGATNPPALKPLPKIERPQITTPFLSLSDTNAANVWRAFGRDKNFPASTWKLQSGILSVISTNKTMIVVKERYIDFELAFEWKGDAETRAALMFGVNEGIENPTGNAYRIPLFSDDSDVKGGARNATASLAGLFGANTNKALRPPGQFNHTRLVVFKDKAEVWLNYRKVNEFSINSEKFKDAVAKNPQYKTRPYFGRPPAATWASNPALDSSCAPPASVPSRNIRPRPSRRRARRLYRRPSRRNSNG